MARKTMKTLRAVSTVVRHDTSAEGNPRWRVYFTDGTSALTPVNSSFGYAVTNYSPRQDAEPPLVVVHTTAHGKVWNIQTLAEAAGEIVSVPLFYAEAGDWAEHTSRDLDPRPVTRVDRQWGEWIWLQILTEEAGPYPAENYTYSRRV